MDLRLFIFMWRYGFILQKFFNSNQYFSHKQQQELNQSSHLKPLDDKNSTSETSLITQSSIIQEYVQFSVYGIREPGEEIKVELVKLITKKLDQTTLDILNQSLARNPKSKLTPQDVEVKTLWFTLLPVAY